MKNGVEAKDKAIQDKVKELWARTDYFDSP